MEPKVHELNGTKIIQDMKRRVEQMLNKKTVAVKVNTFS